MRNTISRAIVGGLAALSLAPRSFATAEPVFGRAVARRRRAAGTAAVAGGWHGGGGRLARWRLAGMAATPVGMAAATGTPATGAAACWYNGWWGPAVAAGLVLGAVAAYPYYGYGGGYDACWQNRPVYSAGGAYLGYQMVNVCQ